MKRSLIYFATTILLSCNGHEQGKETSEIEATPETVQQQTALTCYQYASASDTVSLKLIRIGQALTGTLVYNFKEKDRNQGTIQGSMRDSVLIADYSFLSEGVQSVRQVAFKLEGDSFTEGYGESVEENGKMRFKNIDSLQFNGAVKLVKKECQ